MEQSSILWLFLILLGIAVIVFTYIYLSTKKVDPAHEGMANPMKNRFWFILILFVILSIFASITIPKSPYYLFADETNIDVVHVLARQYEFILSDEAIDTKRPVGKSIELPANQVVEFRVTSMDVNHGFAIYNPEDRLITQTQAMPGYVNRLRYKFSEPGTYTIFCLEYCGMAHQIMRTSFIVK